MKTGSHAQKFRQISEIFTFWSKTGWNDLKTALTFESVRTDINMTPINTDNVNLNMAFSSK